MLATDGSEDARRATDAAISLAKGLSLPSILVTHVIGFPPSQSRMVRAGFDVHSLLEEDARVAVKGTLAQLEEAGVPYVLKVALGDPASELLTIVQKEQVDLIVIGSRGLSALKGALMGSVSQKIAQTAPCPVMIVK